MFQMEGCILIMPVSSLRFHHPPTLRSWPHTLLPRLSPCVFLLYLLNLKFLASQALKFETSKVHALVYPEHA